MSCEATREQLLAGSINEAASHLAECDRCTELAEAIAVGWSDLDRGLDRWSRGGDFDAAFCRAVEEKPMNSPLWYSNRRFHSVLIAAAALFAIFVAFQSRPEPAPAVMPDPIDWSEAKEAVQSIGKTPWKDLSAEEWRVQGLALLKHAHALEQAGAVDDDELVVLLFEVYAQLGRCGENQGNSRPPFYEIIDDATVNLYWYLAGALANKDPALLETKMDKDVLMSIKIYAKLGARLNPFDDVE